MEKCVVNSLAPLRDDAYDDDNAPPLHLSPVDVGRVTVSAIEPVLWDRRSHCLRWDAFCAIPVLGIAMPVRWSDVFAHLQ